MAAAELLADLRSRGYKLTPTAERLQVSPASKLTTDDRQAIAANRDELLALLAGELSARFPQDAAEPAPAALPVVGERWRIQQLGKVAKSIEITITAIDQGYGVAYRIGESAATGFTTWADWARRAMAQLEEGAL